MGNAESQPVRNVDKRTARRDHAPKFMGAIAQYRYDNGLLGEDAHEAQPSEGAVEHGDGDSCQGEGAGTSRLRVCVRQRPIFSHETQAGEFDVLSSDRRVHLHRHLRLHLHHLHHLHPPPPPSPTSTTFTTPSTTSTSLCDRRAMVVHDCRTEADCRRLFISHHTLAFDRVFDGDPNPNPYPNPNPNPNPNPKP